MCRLVLLREGIWREDENSWARTHFPLRHFHCFASAPRKRGSFFFFLFLGIKEDFIYTEVPPLLPRHIILFSKLIPAGYSVIVERKWAERRQRPGHGEGEGGL